MDARSKITAALLGAVVLLGVYQAPTVPLLAIKENQALLAGAANVILVFFVLSLVIERACEVAMDVLTAAGAVPPENPTDTGQAKSNRKLVSICVCLLFSILIVLAGLRMIEMILNVAATMNVAPDAYFKAADALLTTLILAGGSEGIHQMLKPLLRDRSTLTPKA